MCGAMVVGSLLILLSTGNAIAFLPVIGCVLMMQTMGGMGDPKRDA